MRSLVWWRFLPRGMSARGKARCRAATPARHGPCWRARSPRPPRVAVAAPPPDTSPDGAGLRRYAATRRAHQMRYSFALALCGPASLLAHPWALHWSKRTDTS